MAEILIVEDDQATSQMLESITQAADYHAHIAHSVGKAWTILAEEILVDLVLLDNRLKDEWGWQLAQKIRNNIVLQYLPIIVCTGVSDRESILKYIDLKVEGVLVKPPDKQKMLSTMNKHLEPGWKEKFFEDPTPVCGRLNLTFKQYLVALDGLKTKTEALCDKLGTELRVDQARELNQDLLFIRNVGKSLGVGCIDKLGDELIEAVTAQDQKKVNILRESLVLIPKLLEYMKQKKA